MTNDDFRKEMHDYIDGIYDSFLEKREEIVEMLKIFRGICEKHGIQYFVTYGTLLGFYRDKGYIPWDRDIDVTISIADEDKLLAALKTDLPEGYYYRSIFEDPKYPLLLTRIYKKGLDENVYNLDIYNVIGASDDETESRRFVDKYVKVYKDRELANYKPTREKYRRKYAYIIEKIKSFKYVFKTNKSTYKKFKKLIDKYDVNKSKYVVQAYSLYPLPREVFDSAVTMSAYGEEWPVPAGYEQILKNNYKNYMEYMPIKKRMDEMLIGYNSFHGIVNKR